MRASIWTVSNILTLFFYYNKKPIYKELGYEGPKMKKLAGLHAWRSTLRYGYVPYTKETLLRKLTL